MFHRWFSAQISNDNYKAWSDIFVVLGEIMWDAASGNELENMSTTQWPWWWCHYHDHIWCFDVERTSHGGLIFPDSWAIVLQMLGLFPNLVPELWRIWRQFSGNWNGPKITFTGERVWCAGTGQVNIWSQEVRRYSNESVLFQVGIPG